MSYNPQDSLRDLKYKYRYANNRLTSVYYYGETMPEGWIVAFDGPSGYYYNSEFERILIDSNWYTVTTEIKDEYCLGNDYDIVENYLTIRVYDPNGQFSDIFAHMEDVHNSIEDYPLYNDYDFYEREQEESERQITEYLKYDAPAWIKTLPNPDYAVSYNSWNIDGNREVDIETSINNYLKYECEATSKVLLLGNVYYGQPQINVGTRGKVSLANNLSHWNETLDDNGDVNPLLWFVPNDSSVPNRGNLPSEIDRLMFLSDLNIESDR